MIAPVTICCTQFGSPRCAQPIWMHRHRRGAEDGAENRAAAAGQAAAADDDGGDDVELEPDGDRRIADRQPGELQHARDAGQGRGESVDRDLGPLDGHAAQAGRALVRSDREEVPAEARVLRA